MNKAELYARFDNYGRELEEITYKEFYTIAKENDNLISFYNINSIDQYEIRLDGMTYLCYSTTHNIGWQGDVEGHEFYCKIKTLSEKEKEELLNLIKNF
jgi:hypothetical protein